MELLFCVIGIAYAHKTKVAFSVTNCICHDQRVLKIAETVSRLDCEIIIIGRKSGDCCDSDKIHFKTKRFKMLLRHQQSLIGKLKVKKSKNFIIRLLMKMDKQELIRKTFPFLEKELIAEINSVSTLDELLDTIDSIAFMKLDERLVRFFEERFKSTGKTLFSGTHQDIANQLNTSREVISRLLRKLEIKNLVKTERNSVDYSRLIRR